MCNHPKNTKRLKEFEYFAPKTVPDAVAAINDTNQKVVLLAGGTDLLGLMKLGASSPDVLVSLKEIEGLDFIEAEGDIIRIGPMTRIARILNSAVIKDSLCCLHEATAEFATPQVRNMATIGGNICRSSPSADTIPSLIAFGAKIRLTGPNGDRTMLLEEFFTGAGLNVLNREILTEIIVPKPENGVSNAYRKLTRTTSDLGKISCAVNLDVTNGICRDVRIVLGAVADRCLRANDIEEILRGERLSESLFADLGNTLQNSDVTH